MVEILDAKSLKSELEGVSKTEDVEAGAHQAPLNNLTDAHFELLLWSIFEKRIQSEHYYDKATLMVTGADQGRDVWLTDGGNPAGLVQCKRLGSGISLPAAIREIIKFILFSELDPSLLKDGRPFKYSLAVSTDPAKTTIDFFTSPTSWLEKNIDNVKIIDCSWHMPQTKRDGFNEYRNQHIKNSIFFDLDFL